MSLRSQLSPPGLNQTFTVKQILGLTNSRLVYSYNLEVDNCGSYSNVVISEISKGFCPILQMKLRVSSQ